MNDVTKTLKNVVGSVAPKVATALTGPLGGAVVSDLSRRVLGTDQGDQEELVSRMQAMEPEDRKALMDMEQELARISAADRANARARQMETDDRTPAILVYLAFASLVGMAAALLFFEISGPARDIVLMIVGALVTMAKQGYDFFLGSSKGSKDKTSIMAGLGK